MRETIPDSSPELSGMLHLPDTEPSLPVVLCLWFGYTGGGLVIKNHC
jgi:hypothetical protein